MRLFLLIAFIGVWAGSLPAQTPWARSKAGFYAQIGYHTIPNYTNLFGKGSDGIAMIREVSEHTVQCYGEYGLSKSTTAVLSIPYRFNGRGSRNPDSPYFFAVEDTGSISGMGNVSLAIRHQFLREKLALSGTLRVDLPAKKSQPDAGLRTGFNTVTILPSLSLGQGYGPVYWYAYGGYGYRSNHYSHFLNAGAEAGFRVGPVWLVGYSDLVAPLENGSRSLPPLDVLTGLYVNDQGWLSVGIKGIWQVNRFVGVVLSGAGAVWAQYVPQSPGLSAALYFKWD